MLLIVGLSERALDANGEVLSALRAQKAQVPNSGGWWAAADKVSEAKSDAAKADHARELDPKLIRDLVKELDGCEDSSLKPIRKFLELSAPESK